MTYLKRLAGGAALTALVCAMSSAVYAQETTSSLHGAVTASGAPVGKATVTVVHTPSGTRVVTMSDANGDFDVRGLRVGGPYKVTITAPGHAAKAFDAIYLQVGQTFSLDADVESAEVAELVVTGTVNRDKDSGPKTVLGKDAIATIVSVDRDPRDLARHDILVAQDISGGRSGTNAGGVSIAGSNPRFNRLAVDGVTTQDNFGLNQGGLTTNRGPVTLDAVEQFAIAAVPTDVENGDFVGGALNIVLKSGGNQFHGILFDNYLNDGMVGKKSEDTTIKQKISQKNYGAFLSGPIWQDHAFFAASYEKYESIAPTLFGAPGSGAANIFLNGLTQSTIDSVANTYNTVYKSKFNTLGIPTTTPVLDEKYSVKLDWNITDRHRASVTYRRAESMTTNTFNLSATTANLASAWYVVDNVDTATTVELHSNWTDNLSTTFKATTRKYTNSQTPPSGQNYADVSVCTAPTSDATLTSCASGFDTVRFGPDQFRHYNKLAEEETRYQFVGEYVASDHLLKFGAQAREAKPFDVFVPQSHGLYYFDSLADFAAGKAGSLSYQNAVSGNPADAAYNSPYWTYSVFLQDTLTVTPDLKVAVGARYDWYSESDKPIFNPNFLARNGYSNQKTIDGQKILMPRVSAIWTPASNIKLSAGFGLFSGGTPDVITGAPFYNTGYATTGVTINRTATGFTETTGAGGFTNAIGSAGLDNLSADPTFGYTVPTVIQQLQQGTLTGTPLIPPLGAVIALDPSFQMPSQWKSFLSGSWTVGDGWRLSADVVAIKTNHDVTYFDNRSQPLTINGVQQFLPDGRIRYDGLAATVAGKTSSNLGSNNDLIVGNSSKGHSYTVAVGASKTFDWGGDFGIGYAHQQLKDLTPGLFFGTTAGSLYGSAPAGQDPNRDTLGRSVYEIGNRYKFEFGYHHAFFGDNMTRVSLFAERQDGRPFSFLMSDRASGRSAVFGVTKTAQELYVPDFKGDTNTADLNVGLVTFATQADYDNFKRYVTNFGLPNNALVDKYSKTNAPIGRLDMQFSQELPSFFEGHKIKVNLDVRNVLNLVNNKWGRVAEYGDQVLVKVDCADANGVAIASTSAACPRYKYSQVPTSVTKTQNAAASLWYVQLGLRYEF
ncbi:TonB-dependent receptor domain-containing protein [Phenylobacterium aquaticum]|uniref:TonB-dependent receptor n=1 Tax=Phenylobacterium aquaticum TaxID=1763816 RepID=UPI0026EE8633|nr:TonB-dependent receptor [Phenylobacterium aquaticum]